MKTMEMPKLWDRYRIIGWLDQQTVYEDRATGELCIERDFERLCEMCSDEIQRVEAVQEQRGDEK